VAQDAKCRWAIWLYDGSGDEPDLLAVSTAIFDSADEAEAASHEIAQLVDTPIGGGPIRGFRVGWVAADSLGR
jgi:hypothetical protein